MSDSEATVTLVYRAKNLADAATRELTDGLRTIGNAAQTTAGKFTAAFAGFGEKTANAIGMVTETLASGGSWGQALAGAGVFMAGQLAESFGGQLIERLASSSLVAAITAPLSALGTAAGSLISAAIPIGMAALPVILVGALVAVVAVLATNPEIRGKVVAFAGSLVHTIASTVGGLVGTIVGAVGKVFSAAWSFVVGTVLPFVGQIASTILLLPFRLAGLGVSILETIIGGLVGLPARIADIIGSAFRNLRLDIGPFHIDASGVRVDLPQLDLPHFAAGVRNFRGGVALVGEEGPELVRLPRGADVIPNNQLRAAATSEGGAGFTLVGVSRAELERIADEGLYVRLVRSAPSLVGGIG